jgi:hypothetical protein
MHALYLLMCMYVIHITRKSLTVIPRAKSHEFVRIPAGDNLPVWTLDEVSFGTGEEGKPHYLVVNDKVREYIGPTDVVAAPTYYRFYKMQKLFGNAEYDVIVSKMLFDPKYGVVDRREDMTREHAASIEHFHMTNSEPGVFRTIALFPRIYRD